MSEASAKAGPRSLRGKILMVIAAMIVAALGYLAWSTQKPREPVTVVPTATPTSQPAGYRAPSSRPALPPRHGPRVFRRAPLVAPPPAPDGGAPRAGLTRNDVRVAQAQLHRAADTCVEDALKANPDLGLRMAIRYTLHVQGGQARAINPRVTKSLLNDPQVEKCIIEKVSNARWEVNASDGILNVAETFNFKHLMRTHISD